MPIDLNAVGQKTEPYPVEWTSTDAILYALGVGAGAEDAAKELAFTTENVGGVRQQVLPTFAVVLGSAAPMLSYGSFDRSKSVHAAQELIQHEPLPTAGKGMVQRELVGIHDKTSGALVTWRTTLTAEDGRLLASQSTGAFVRGEGGFGGDRGPTSHWAAPDRVPDAVVEQHTRTDQALLYRLSGDRNPLHVDPALAVRVGFPRPILHGLCSFGFVGRAVLALIDGDPAHFRSMKLRFSAPVLPGDTLTTSFWRDGGTILFRSAVGNRLVLDGGEAEVGA
jgi:acyl dehydratase